MKISFEINNVTNSPVEDGFFMAVAKRTFEKLNYNFLKNREIEISLALVTKEEIRKWNKEYRKNDSVTDILSFPEYRTEKEIKAAISKKSGSKLFLGELILCYDDIRQYADKEGVKVKKELAKVISHGILHLLGFEHGERMFSLQKEVAEKISN
jgi:probable rRNA maturation factor